MKKEANEDLISFGARQGLIDAKPLDLAHPETLGAAMQERIGQARALQRKYTDAPLKIFTKQEDAQVSAALKTMSAKNKSLFFGALAHSTNDSHAYRVMMQQIAPDDPATALAGVFTDRGIVSSKARAVGESMLRGQEILKPISKIEDGKPIKGQMPMPEDKEFLAKFSMYEKGAFAGLPETRNAVFQGARLLYADRSDREGDYSGKLNTDRWETSQELATGGIIEHNGKGVVLPYGMPYADFKDGLKARLKALESAGRLPSGTTADRLYNMPVRTVGDGQYSIPVGDSEQGDKDGKRITIDFNAPLAPVALPKLKSPANFIENRGGAATGTKDAKVREPSKGSTFGGMFGDKVSDETLSSLITGKKLPPTAALSGVGDPAKKAQADLDEAITARSQAKSAKARQALDYEIENLRRIVRETKS